MAENETPKQPIVVDIAKAIEQLEKNPELGHKLNQMVLGDMVAEQLKTMQDLTEEAVSRLEAARTDLADAKKRIGKLYVDVYGVMKSLQINLRTEGANAPAGELRADAVAKLDLALLLISHLVSDEDRRKARGFHG